MLSIEQYYTHHIVPVLTKICNYQITSVSHKFTAPYFLISMEISIRLASVAFGHFSSDYTYSILVLLLLPL